MTLDGHLKTGLAATLLLTTHLLPNWTPDISGMSMSLLAICFFLGHVGPDFMEMRIIPHRTITHYPYLYALIIGGGYASFQVLEPSLIEGYSVTIYCAMAYSAGALMHIICDMPYGRVPWGINPMRPIGLFFVKFDSITNRIIEHSVLIAILAAWVLWDVDVNSLVESTIQTNPFDTPLEEYEE